MFRKELKKKYKLYRYTAEADHEPENLYQYAGTYGTGELIFIFDDLLKAMGVLSENESTCTLIEEEGRSHYEVVCYALESEEV